MKHPYGHIGIAINDSTSEFSMDSSDKLRHKIDEDNYSGVVCFMTSHSEASFATCVAVWGAKCKNDRRPSVIAPRAALTSYVVDLTPRQIFETAVACKEEYFKKYTIARNCMPTNHQEQDGYIVGPSVKTPLLARNARPAPVRKPPVRKTYER